MARRKPKRLVGVETRGKKRRANVKINGRKHVSPWGTETDEVLKQWRVETVEKFAEVVDPAGTFAADIPAYMARVKAMPTYKERERHLWVWVKALGRDRSRHSIAPKEIEQVVQEWLLAGMAPGTAKKRRASLQSFFVKMNGPTGKNPVKGTFAPKEPKPEARHIDRLLIEQALAAMPVYRSKRGVDGAPVLSLSRLRAAVIANTGIPPGTLQRIQPHDLVFVGEPTVHLPARLKGDGVAADTLQISGEALAAFRAFHAANAYGRFATTSLNRLFKKACKAVGLDPRRVRLYDLRHSFLTDAYDACHDQATVARLARHAPGSKMTARYTQGANDAVNRAAVNALDAMYAERRRHALKVAPDAPKLPDKVTNDDNLRVINHLQRRS